ncbi:MAG: AAA domain-containing protein [Actinomycetota bacterium]|nr:AAA domain-containing protein [Actinomycetota bacterium]
MASSSASEPAGWLFGEGIGVITPHRAQRALLTMGLQRAFPAISVDQIDASVDTVERFQGQERWAILASYAVGDPDTVAEEDEFLQNLNRFNVLATRAKAKVIVTIIDEVLAHIETDLDVIRSSRLIKSFADTYCNQRAHLTVTHVDRQGNPQAVDLTIRWRQ